MSANPYTNDVSTVIEMFTDATPNESTKYNRLITQELPSGNIALVGYGEKILAEYDETEERVTLYLGHKAGGHTTITRWLNEIQEVASARRTVTFSDKARWFEPAGGPNTKAGQYIREYIDFTSSLSDVEENALEDVIKSLEWLDDLL